MIPIVPGLVFVSYRCGRCLTTKKKMAGVAQVPMTSVHLRWANCSLRPTLSMQDIQACMQNYGQVCEDA